jgi:hypothetical protein
LRHSGASMPMVQRCRRSSNITALCRAPARSASTMRRRAGGEGACRRSDPPPRCAQVGRDVMCGFGLLNEMLPPIHKLDDSVSIFPRCVSHLDLCRRLDEVRAWGFGPMAASSASAIWLRYRRPCLKT